MTVDGCDGVVKCCLNIKNHDTEVLFAWSQSLQYEKFGVEFAATSQSNGLGH